MHKTRRDTCKRKRNVRYNQRLVTTVALIVALTLVVALILVVALVVLRLRCGGVATLLL
jgi:hypothetical protein